MLLFSWILLLMLPASGNAQGKSPCFETPYSVSWADSVFDQLDYYEKIGQLFMVDAFSNKDSLHVAQIRQLIDSFHIGGLIFFQGGPLRQAVLTNDYQGRSKVPLLIGIDGEWGLQMRLDSTIRFPRQMTLSAGCSEEDVYRMAREIGRQCIRMGIHINFAPDIDINNNPSNPIINSRSFGENREQVARMGLAYMRGLQDEGVLACGKHFPGHGDTDTDSHLSLPVIYADPLRLDTMELFPFRKLSDEGLASIMVAHLFVPGVDTTLNRASTLSPAIVQGLLKSRVGFGGLVFTDALNMKGVASFYEPGELEVKALQAGNDVLLYPRDVGKALEKIHLAIQNCELEQDSIDNKVKKILRAKAWSTIAGKSQVDTAELNEQLNNAAAQWLNCRLYEKAPVLLKNKHGVVPLNTYYRDCIAAVSLGDVPGNNFHRQLQAYGHVDTYSLPKDVTDSVADDLLKKLKDYDRVIVSIHNTSINAQKNFGLSPQVIRFTELTGEMKGDILVVFGNPYVLGRLQGVAGYDAVVEAFEDTRWPQVHTAQKLFGAGAFEGKLPVSVEPGFSLGTGLHSNDEQRLRFTMPEAVGLDARKLKQIDVMLQAAVRDSFFPGAQVLLAKNGKVIYHEAVGYTDYSAQRKVTTDDLYDIASVTKIASTALAAMYLYDKRKLDLDAKISRYLPEFRTSNKADLTIRELMAHQSGLKAWIPFWKSTVDSSTGILDARYYRMQQEKGFSTRVADSIFLKDDYQEQIWREIMESPLEKRGQYVYSDIGMIILQKIIERQSGKTLDRLVQDVFYKPLGMWQTGYHPLEWADSSKIIPTELDTIYRQQLIKGYVHDPAAAMMGGVGGHAGVFSNAQSLAIFLQLLLNEGSYAGKQYLRPQTVRLFTAKAYPDSSNRRGLIFDKPDPMIKENGPSPVGASLASFGHSGFTGTFAWADPENGLLYVFLSNRVHPSAGNTKLAKSNLRTRLTQVVLDAMGGN